MERRSPTGIARGARNPLQRPYAPRPIPHGAPVSDRHRWSAGLRPASLERRSPTGIARERETRTNNATPYRREWRTPCSIRTAPLAPLRGAVPTERSAFPCLRVACAQSGLRRPPACGGLCRPEVGGPLPARHRFPVGYVRRPPSYGTWATRRSLRSAQRCRPEVGGPLPARHPFPVGYLPRWASYRTWATRGFAALRAAVPTGGPAGPLPAASSFPGGVRAETSVIRDKQNEMARRKSRVSRELPDELLGGEDPPEAIRSGELLAQLQQSLAE